MIIREISIDKFSDKTLREIDLTNRYNCQIIAVKKQYDAGYRYIPKADDLLNKGDTLIVIGSRDSLSSINP
jgi:trk system potassium uptake protein TrkA